VAEDEDMQEKEGAESREGVEHIFFLLLLQDCATLHCIPA
jgi:hypothetical protein